MKQKDKQSKGKLLKYDKLKIQEYLAPGVCNIKVAKLIVKARTETLDIKTQQRWRYDDGICAGCGIAEETGDELLNCKALNENMKQIKYEWFYSEKEQEILEAAIRLKNAMKKREKLIESRSNDQFRVLSSA